jgi:hypothetical protein
MTALDLMRRNLRTWDLLSDVQLGTLDPDNAQWHHTIDATGWKWTHVYTWRTRLGKFPNSKYSRDFKAALRRRRQPPSYRCPFVRPVRRYPEMRLLSAACRGLARLGPSCLETRLGSPGCNADIPSSARSRSGLRCGCRLERHAASRSVPASPACHSGRSGPGVSLPRRPCPDSTQGPCIARCAYTSAVAFSEEQQACCLVRSAKNR